MSEQRPDTDAPPAYGETDLTYNSYLKVEELLGLQQPQTDPPHHDEMLFIVIHQTYELWFKLVLHELEQAIAHMNRAPQERGMVLRARHFVQRVVEIAKVLVKQIHVLETMAPVEFLGFRHRLMPASGFQSVQFREVEYLCGVKNPAYLKYFAKTPESVATLQARLDGPDVRTSFYDMLRGLGFSVPADVSYANLDENQADREALYQALIPLYADPERHLALNLLAESLVSLDQWLALWREHHVRVVERIIGHKRGTGGSSGVGYLRSTTSKKIFPCLFEMRTHLTVSGGDEPPPAAGCPMGAPAGEGSE